MSRRHLAIFACLVVVLGACATKYAQTSRRQSSFWREGFAHGCDSGFAGAGNPFYTHTKDASRADTDERYRKGWQAGFDGCTQQHESMFGWF